MLPIHEFYRIILGLIPPWFVTTVEILPEIEEVLVHLEHSLGNFPCPECQYPSPVYDHLSSRKWRHLDTCQLKTYLVACVPRVNCPTHGIHAIAVKWTSPHSRFTLLFERFALDVLLATKVQVKAARLLRLSPGQIHDIMIRGVNRGLSRRNPEESRPHLSIDEKSFKKGHMYVTVLSDPSEKSVIDIAESRTLEATTKLIKESLTPKQQASAKSISMDMWVAFQNAARSILPQADIVHDRFHVAKYLNDALDNTRRAEQRSLLKEGNNVLSRSKFMWMKSPENLTEKQLLAFEQLVNLDLETAKVYAFKESFRAFFSQSNVAEAKSFFEDWFNAAIALQNRHLDKVANMLKNHLEGLLAYIKHKVSNGHAEGINGQIQLLKANARGYRKFQNFRIAVLFFLGKLEVYPY